MNPCPKCKDQPRVVPPLTPKVEWRVECTCPGRDACAFGKTEDLAINNWNTLADFWIDDAAKEAT